jgi:hypothetical protein
MVRFDLLMQKVLLFAGVIAVPFVPTVVHAQALYAPTTGIYFTAALDQPYLFSYERLFYLGAGVRLSSGTDLGVRAGRSRGVPPGNPLPVIYIGETVVEGQLSHRIQDSSGQSGVRLLLASQLIVQDHSQAVERLPEPVTFRGGRRVTEGLGRIEVQRYWQVSESNRSSSMSFLGGSPSSIPSAAVRCSSTVVRYRERWRGAPASHPAFLPAFRFLGRWAAIEFWWWNPRSDQARRYGRVQVAVEQENGRDTEFARTPFGRSSTLG